MDKTYCIFGDSVTQAGYVKVGWVDLLRQYLEEKYKDDFINVFNLGINGNTSSNVLKRFENEALVRNPSSILFAVGINDTKDYNPKQFKANIEKLIGIANKFSQDITFVGLVLGDWQGEDPFNRDRTTKYNELIKEVTKQKECKFIPLQDILYPEDFMDGLHPNDQGHKKMFEVIKGYF